MRLRIDVAVRHSGWGRSISEPQLFARRVLCVAAAAESARPGAVGVVFAGDALVRRLNRVHRRKDKATNVLSFRSAQMARGMPAFLGEIVLAYQTVRREADRQGKPLPAHAAHLLVHGFLHLIGHDHRRAGEARRMEALETAILAGLGIPDPYAPAAAQ